MKLLATFLLLSLVVAALADGASAPPVPVPVPGVTIPPAPGQPFAPWLGRSGRVRALFVPSGKASRELLENVLAAPKKLVLAAGRPGIYDLGVRAPDGAALRLFALVPFREKKGTRLGKYRLGRWPQETTGSPNGYVAPDGFVRVEQRDARTPVSAHFRVGDFLTHDQPDVWPKYLVLRSSLLDKLELVADALSAAGRSDSIRIMSGFRTPSYNAQGVGAGGRAEDSRHIYGDAGDIFVDADGDSVMDDLDGDGKVTLEDAKWLAALVEGVEADHPELVGGLSPYPATAEHGPFVHVDVRGRAARW
jgi:Peptidase M15